MKARLLADIPTQLGIIPAGTLLDILREHADGTGERKLTLGRDGRIVVSECPVERVERIEE